MDPIPCLVCKDLIVPNEVYHFKEFNVLGCHTCGSTWRSNMYDPQKIQELYVSDSYDTNPYFHYDDTTFKRSERYGNYQRALRLLTSFNGFPGRLLDVACGNGSFLRTAKEKGWQVEGVELSPKLAASCTDAGFLVFNSMFEEVSVDNAKYDAITFWDIIEHVIDVPGVIEKAKSLLKPGGIVMFCTPNEGSLLARTGRMLYDLGYSYPALALHPTYHTYFFARKQFCKLLEKNNLTVLQSYSQKAFFEHSKLANGVQKLGIDTIEKVASVFDNSYEFVVAARHDGV
jgi:SAM-dependent methyltransferase